MEFLRKSHLTLIIDIRMPYFSKGEKFLPLNYAGLYGFLKICIRMDIVPCYVDGMCK